jgi:K+-sensing histidine kinase KdpD
MSASDCGRFSYLLLIFTHCEWLGIRRSLYSGHAVFQLLLSASDRHPYYCRSPELGRPVQLLGHLPNWEPLVHPSEAQALEAIEHRQDVERLYSFSRAILLIDRMTPFPGQVIEKLIEIFHLDSIVLYERRSREFYRSGSSVRKEVENHLPEAAASSAFSSFGVENGFVIMSVRLGSEPVASMILGGAPMPLSVLQGIANLVAFGLERAHAQELAQQIDTARQSEQLRTTLIDAMAHEFKTPLTLIKAPTSSLLGNPNQPLETRTEQLKTANEEAEHLRQLIDDAVEMRVWIPRTSSYILRLQPYKTQ